MLATPFPDGYHREFDVHEEYEVYEAMPQCITVFLRVSEPFDDDNSYDAYQDPIFEHFKADRDELAAVLDERWGPRCPSDVDAADFSAVLLEYLQAWPVYAWVHGDRVALLGVQKTEREHPFELCVAIARRWTDSAPTDETLWPLFVRQLCDRSPATANPAMVPLWQSREPTSPREREYLREKFANLRQNLLAELAAVWGPPLAPRPDAEDPVTPALDGLDTPSRESVDVWRRGDRLVVTGVTTEQDDSLVLFAAVIPHPAAP
ncbi:hypothetical protein [Streptomyces sp. NPDC050428]|uniref:hypothetical protein n=1 Tax=Streptomyces sp. NPDC050428 TaxID=3155757 RepID=UPI00341C8734